MSGRKIVGVGAGVSQKNQILALLLSKKEEKSRLNTPILLLSPKKTVTHIL